MKNMKQYSHSEAINYLNSLIWHDSILYEIKIVRANSADQAVIIFDLIIDEENFTRQRTKLTLNDCYLIETRMNGGVNAISDGEMICEASAKSESPKINGVVELWEKIFRLEGLLHFSMILASTNSELEIVCKSITVTEDKKE
jgi:hypothetical protein